MPLAKQDLVAYFTERFGQAPALVVRAPGRVNLIGEHTDYNDGFVLPLAIDRAAWIALRPRGDCRVKVYSIDYQEDREFGVAGLKHEKAGWIEYLKGVAWCLQDAGMKLQGWEGVLAGDVPLGAGLSSSAALEMATARAFAAVSGIAWDAVAQAKLGSALGKQMDRRELRHHGPVDLLHRPRGPCHAHRLPLAGIAARAAARRRGGRGPRYGDASRAGRFGLQRAPLAVRSGGRLLPSPRLARRDAWPCSRPRPASWTPRPAAARGT